MYINGSPPEQERNGRAQVKTPKSNEQYKTLTLIMMMNKHSQSARLYLMIVCCILFILSLSLALSLSFLLVHFAFLLVVHGLRHRILNFSHGISAKTQWQRAFVFVRWCVCVSECVAMLNDYGYNIQSVDSHEMRTSV